MNKIFAAVFGLLFFLCSSCAAYSPQGYVFVTMLDVGQGDSFLIETPEKNILLDAGDVLDLGGVKFNVLYLSSRRLTTARVLPLENLFVIRLRYNKKPETLSSRRLHFLFRIITL